MSEKKIVKYYYFKEHFGQCPDRMLEHSHFWVEHPARTLIFYRFSPLKF